MNLIQITQKHLLTEVLIRLTQEDKANALADLEAAHQLKPHVKQIWDLVISLKIEFKQFEKAIVLLTEMTQIDQTNEQRFAILALCHQYLGEYEEAIVAYKKALSIKPHYTEAYVNMGSAFKDQGKLEETIEAFNKALSLKPDYTEAYNNMGNVLKDQVKLEEAMQAYNKAISLKPDYAEAYYNMGSSPRSRQAGRGYRGLQQGPSHQA